MLNPSIIPAYIVAILVLIAFMAGYAIAVFLSSLGLF